MLDTTPTDTRSPSLSDRPTAETFPLPEEDDLWVFGYGSLMWRPEFDFLEQRHAQLYGLHRRFCILSHRYRGTEENPGLVLGLAPGGSCHGVVFRIARARAREILIPLWDREMVTGVYRPGYRRVKAGAGWVSACCFVADPKHHQFCGNLDFEAEAKAIVAASGSMGPNADYLFNTIEHLAEIGIHDRALSRLGRRVRELSKD
ncbi:MAG: gamma-glutamylcyclotransferase [Pseudomonadota bacterium]